MRPPAAPLPSTPGAHGRCGVCQFPVLARTVTAVVETFKDHAAATGCASVGSFLTAGTPPKAGGEV